MAKSAKRAALYVRVSTDHQSVENEIRELRQVAERRGWQVVETYQDAGISGSKGRGQRPGLDAMLNDASRRKFDVVMAWAIDRLGRSLIDLLGTIDHGGRRPLPGSAEYRHHHAPRKAPVSNHRRLRRVRALDDPGLGVIKGKLARDGKFESKAGIVRTRLGRPGVESKEPKKIERARLELAKGTGIIKTAKLIGLGVSTVHRLKRESEGHAAN